MPGYGAFCKSIKENEENLEDEEIDDTIREALANIVDGDTTIYRLGEENNKSFCLQDQKGIYAIQKQENKWICSCGMAQVCIHVRILR